MCYNILFKDDSHKRSQEMFRIEFFCEDKNLPRILRALTGLSVGQPRVQPVANAETTGEKIKQRTNGNAVDLFSEWIKKRKLTFITPTLAREFAVEHGYMEKSYSLILKNLVAAKLIRRDPTKKSYQSRYIVLPAGKSK